jgi:hypothetical protein
MVPAHKSVEEALEQKARLLDLSSDAILARDASDRITLSHDLLRTEFPEPLQSIKEKLVQDARWAGELRHKCADGSTVTDSSGQFFGVVGSGCDMVLNWGDGGKDPHWYGAAVGAGRICGISVQKLK